MDPPADCKASPSPPPTQQQEIVERAREKLMAISQAGDGSDLQDMERPLVGGKDLQKDEKSPCPASSPPSADQDEVYRRKLISLSYEGASLASGDSNGGSVAPSLPTDGPGCPPS